VLKRLLLEGECFSTFKMDARVFLHAQDWLIPASLSSSSQPVLESYADATNTSAKRPNIDSLECKTRFHICLEEQQTPESSTPASGAWLGLLANSAVNIKLRLPDGSSKATLDANISLHQEQQQPPQGSSQVQGSQQQAALQIGWYGQQYRVCDHHIIKVRFLSCHTAGP
jgi:hypothetical protein